MQLKLKQYLRYKTGKIYDKLNNTGDDNPKTNGEYFHLQNILEGMTFDAVIFDVGGHKGMWSKKALQIKPNSKIFVFEPIPMYQKIIDEKFSNDKRVTLVPVAVSNEDGETNMDTNTQSLYERGSVGRDNKESDVKVNTISLENFIDKNKIKKIHYMKMDIEGHEVKVLSSLDNLLQKGFFDHIQFEYGGCNIDSRTYLLDFFRIFKNCPYDIFKIHQHHLEHIPTYSQSFEDFRYSNWLVKRKL